jgi:hypothetical protein
MASQLNITFNYQAVNTLTYGRIEVVHITEAGQRNTYTLFPFTISDTGPAATFAVSSTNDAFTAQQFAFVFNTKFRGPINGNFDPMFEVNGNVVSLIAETGTFLPATYRDGDVLDIIPVVTDLEDPPENEFRFSQDPLQRGDCSTTKWAFQFAIGGDPPYNIIDSANENILVENWSGFTTELIDFERGKLHTGRVEDQNNSFIGTYSIYSPQNIQNGDFTTEQRNFINTSDLIVNQIIVRSNTGADLDANGNPTSEGRIEYAVAQFVPGVGVDINALVWQESNIFAGLVPGRYKLYIRDKYGCIISRDIQINEFDPNINLEPGEVTDYFSTTEYNSLSFKRSVEWDCEIRKNYETTLSHEEAVCLPYQAVFKFPLDTVIQTQFKSSYPFHIVTLYKCDGTKESLPHTRIQENISQIERVSAKLFPYNNGQENLIGVYFEGGDTFEPGTNDVIGSSPYFQVLPTWAQTDRVVEISTESGLNFGARTIVQTDLYDSQRNTLFMVVDGSLGTLDDITDAIIEVRYNRHPYDVYRFDFSMFDGSGYIVIEPGFDENSIVQNEIRVSETFEVLKNCDNWIVSEWYLDKSVGEAVAYESFKGEMWMQGRLRPISVGSAETLDADDQTRSIDQDEKLNMRLTVNILEPKKWRKLGLASAIGNRGEFVIQDLPLVRTSAMNQEELGQTNKSNIEIEFAYAAETPRTRPEEVVLDIGVGGGDGTPSEPVTGWDGWIRIIRSDSPEGVPTYLKDDQGNFVVAGRIDT